MIKVRGVFLAETREEGMSQQATPERIFGIGLLASVIASLMAGIGARIIMRIVALTAHMPLSFSITGSLNVVFFGFFLGLIAGFIYTGCVVAFSSSPKVRKYLPGPIGRGLTFGVLLLVIGGLPSVLIPLLPKEDLNSEAKDLCVRLARSFASLRMTSPNVAILNVFCLY
jgi:hypothetical protein